VPASRYTSQTANAQAIAVTMVTMANAQTKCRCDDMGIAAYRPVIAFSRSSEVNFDKRKYSRVVLDNQNRHWGVD
jgi:hypothetical protein